MSFNFDTASSCGIYYANESVDSDLTKVRLHHLDIIESGFVFVRRGLAHGVMDNCNIQGSMDMAGTVGLWGADNGAAAYEFGNASNFYFEDNAWTPYSQSESFFQAGNGDGRYAFRYNAMTLPDDTMTSPLFDLHGNQSSADSGFGAELYGNSVTAPYNGPQHFYAQRGGKSLVFDNFVNMSYSGATSTWAIEEHLDSETSFPTQAYNGQPQHVSDSYYWSNFRNSEILNPSSETTLYYSDLGRDVPMADYDVWLYTASFDGSSGVGCGTLSARPAACATGVGYWATDQSCSDLTGMAGAHPSTPISGTLYRCTAPDTWTAYYTPLPYPHPLRTDCALYPTLCDPAGPRPRAPTGLTVI